MDEQLATDPLRRAPLGALNGPLAGTQAQKAAPSSGRGTLSFTQYHTGWMDRQEAAFGAWLNAVLVPAADSGGAGAEGGAAADGQQPPRGLAARRLTARLRGLLWKLYSQDQELISVMLKVEQRIDGGQLRLRDEESIMKNVKEAGRAREVLGSFHPLWLRLGMEVVVGQVLTGEDAPVTATELAAFVRERFLADPQLAKQHHGSGKPYWAALAKLVVKRVLLLAALLDRAAALPSLPCAAPLLFRRDSKLKASMQVVAEFLQPRLVGEGDVARTLGRLGYKLAYTQDPRREVDFAVANMATDLRDGLRLCKLAGLLTGQPRFFDSTRFPSDRRPVRVANMQLALDRFAAAGMLLQGARSQQGEGTVLLAAGDLVDGDREMTLCLLWRLIVHFQLPQLLSLSALRAEIELVQSKTAASDAAPCHPPEACGAAAESSLVAALLEWAAAICAQYGLAVQSFGECFGDGSVFCLLVHHYLGKAYIDLKQVFLPNPATTDGWTGRPAASQLEGVKRNFGMVQSVVQSLGGIPAMVSAEDLAEHGHDEKGCILFTAFLCQRLLEISKEERAAMVMQRHWRNRHQNKPGSAREHLHRWIAAASVVQRAVRAWRLRRGLERFAAQRRLSLAAVVRLQALWRGRAVRQQYQQQRQAAVCIQAVWRGKMGRRTALHQLVVPRMLEAGLQRMREMEASRQVLQGRLERASVSIQAAVRRWQQQRRYQQQRAAALAVQAAFRGWQQCSRYQQLRKAAVSIQCAWRRTLAVRMLAHAKEEAAHREALRRQAAAVVVQAAWRAKQARVLAQQHRAARRLQAAFKGHAVRRRLEQHQQAAVRLQAAWRGLAVRRACQQQHAAAVQLQAAWRRHAARTCFLQQQQAALTIQRHTRGFLARRRLQQQHAAAAAIQAAVRAWQRRQREASVAAVKRQMAEMARLMRLYQQRTAAALKIQAAYRGHAARQEYRRQLAVVEEQRRVQQERQAAALAVIAPWAQTFRDRVWFLRARRAAPVLQAWWRQEYARRAAAATAIQAAYRCHAAQQRLQRSRQAALVIQTAWHGFHVRSSHPRHKQLADIRLRLAAATATAATSPHRSLGARTRAHLDALLAAKHPTAAVNALNGLALCCEAVLACGDIVVAGGGMPVLLGILKAPSRSKETAEALQAALNCVANICKSRRHADSVFEEEGLLNSLGDHLQQQRDKEEVFMAAVGLWHALVCRSARRAEALARQPAVMAKLDGVARLLALKLEGDKKYLQKLENQKGSDVSARQATKALLATTRQLRALRAVLAATGASAEVAAGAGAGSAEEPLQLGKNVIVRAVLREGH